MEKYIEKYCYKHGLTKYAYVKSSKKYVCVKCRCEQVNQRRTKLKQALIDYKGGKCEICGYNKCNAALEFHHKDPNEKDFGLAYKGYTHSLEACKKEVDKCILVCSNCHREIHDEIRRKEYEENNVVSEPIKRVSASKIYLNINIVNELIKQGLKQTEISEKIGVSLSTLKRFLKENNMNKKNNYLLPGKMVFEDTELIKLMKEHKNYSEVGRLLGISDNTVRKHMKRNGYPTNIKDLIYFLENNKL